jgi:hypothetical protein
MNKDFSNQHENTRIDNIVIRVISIADKKHPGISGTRSQKDILRKIINNASRGEATKLLEGTPPLRAYWIKSILADNDFCRLVQTFGLRIEGATIEGDLWLDNISLNFPMELKQCKIQGNIWLRDAKTAFLSLQGSSCKMFYASRLSVNGDLDLNSSSKNKDKKFTASRGVFLRNALVSGDINFSGAELRGDNRKINPDYEGKSLVLDRAEIRGSVCFCDGFASQGEVSMEGISIEGNLKCKGASFHDSTPEIIQKHHRHALVVNYATIQGEVDFREAIMQGQVVIIGANIRGSIKCDKAAFVHCIHGEDKINKVIEVSKDKNNHQASTDQFLHAFSLDRSRIEGSVVLRDSFISLGQVRLINTFIKGDLDCSAGNFYRSLFTRDPLTLLIDRANIGGNVFLTSSLTNPNKTNPNKTNPNKKLCTCNGNIVIQDTTVGRNLELRNLSFSISDQVSLQRCDNEVHDNVKKELENAINVIKPFLKEQKPDKQKSQTNLVLNGLDIKGRIIWEKVLSNINYQKYGFEIRYSNAARLEHDWYDDDWYGAAKKHTQFDLTGFTYQEIIIPESTKNSTDKEKLLSGNWLGLTKKLANSNSPNRPNNRSYVVDLQPYEQFATALERAGYWDKARAIRIKGAKLKRTNEIPKEPDKKRGYNLILFHLRRLRYILWSCLLNLIKYGYEPWRIWKYALIFLMIGWGVFYTGYNRRYFIPSDLKIEEQIKYIEGKESEILGFDIYPTFFSPIYSLEKLVPLIEFNQGKYWRPYLCESSNVESGNKKVQICSNSKLMQILLHCYLFFHQLIGWVITTLGVYGFTKYFIKESR